MTGRTARCTDGTSGNEDPAAEGAGLDTLDEYVAVWLDNARAGRAISALRDTHLSMLRSELSSLRAQLDRHP